MSEIITNEQPQEIAGDIEVPVEIHVNPGSVRSLLGKTLTIENIGDNNYQKIDISGKTNIILDIKMNSKIGKVQWLGLCARIDGYPPYFIFDYVKKNNRNLVQKSESAGQTPFKAFSKF